MVAKPTEQIPIAGQAAPAPLRAMARIRSWRPFYRMISLLTFVVLIVIWFVITQELSIGQKVLASPGQLLSTLKELFNVGYADIPLWTHIGVSLGRMLVGFGIAAVVAVPIGILMGMSRLVKAILSPILSLLRPIPSIAYIPLVILWLGIGEVSKVGVVFVAAFLYILPATTAGVASVSEGWKRVAVNLGASRFQLFIRVIVPGSLPYIFTGLKTGLGVSWTVMVAAELIAAQKGLGFMIMDAATFFRIPVVYIGVLLIGIIGLLMSTILEMVEVKVIHWRGKH